MRKAGVDWQIVIYGGAVHSFTNPDAGHDPSRGAAYNEKADRRSWEAMKVFFERYLNKRKFPKDSICTSCTKRSSATPSLCNDPSGTSARACRAPFWAYQFQSPRVCLLFYPLSPPRAALYYIFNLFDDEFPASATCLFPSNAAHFLPVAGLAETVEYTAKKIIELVMGK